MEYYQERGLIPAPLPPLKTSGKPLAADMPTTSVTHQLNQPATFSIDSTRMQAVANQTIVLENCGPSNIDCPRVVINGKRDWYDGPSMLAEIMQGDTDPKRRAFRVWQFIRNNRYHWYPAEAHTEIHDPVKFLNVYGYGFCDDCAANSEALWKMAGFENTRCWGISGHCIPEVFYESSWHMLDPDLQVFYPTDDNQTVAGVENCAAEGSLVRRISGPAIEQLYTTTGNNYIYSNDWENLHTMAVTLRPGESIERNWFNWGKFHDCYMIQKPPVFGNGRMIYHPTLAGGAVLDGLDACTNLACADTEQTTPILHIIDPLMPSSMILSMNSPYLFVGGTLHLDAVAASEGDGISVDFSKDGESWSNLGSVWGPFSGPVDWPLDNAIATNSSGACYSFRLRFNFNESEDTTTGLNGLKLTGEIECAPAALPTLEPGVLNNIAVNFFADEGAALRIRQDYNYLPSDHAQPGLPQPLEPLQTAFKTEPAFSWDWENTNATGYEIRVAWDDQGIMPVAPPLWQNTGLNQIWQSPADWLLLDQKYYWQVRYQGLLGDWRPWSPAWPLTISSAGTAAKRSWMDYR